MNPVLNLVKCCCSLGTTMKGYISPFHRAVVLEYDGALVVGVARCGDCGCCYKVVRLGDVGPPAAYSLARLPGDSLSKLETAYSKIEKPSWPIWVLPGVAKIKSNEQDDYDRLEAATMARAGTPELVIITKHLINGRVLAAVDYVITGARDWRTIIGV